jgi:hypothetical protein
MQQEQQQQQQQREQQAMHEQVWPGRILLATSLTHIVNPPLLIESNGIL